MTAPHTTVPPPPEPGLTDLVEIYYAPSDVFRRREGGEFGIPLLVLAVVMTALYYASASAMQPVMDAEWARGMPGLMRKFPKATPEMLASMKATIAKFAGWGVALVGLVGPLLTGLVVWLVARMAGVRATLGRACMIATFAFYPIIVEMAVNAAQALVLPDGAITSRQSLSVGPARFLDAASTSPVVMAVVGHVDLFTIWTAVLIALGLKVTARATTAQAATVAAIVWLIGLVPTLLGALRAG